MIKILHLKAFEDNYIWLIQLGCEVIVVDPGDATQVIDYITKHQLILKSILITHGHADHIGGVKNLLNFKAVPVYGMVSCASRYVDDGDVFELFPNIKVTVIKTLGHTDDGVSYLVNGIHLFCGDTLFAAGCGRVFTHNYVAMFASLNKIKKLPKQTLIYPAHEYTVDNLRFAQFVDAKNVFVESRLQSEQNKLNANNITLPTTLELELATNPFLRCNNKNMLNFVKQITIQDIKNELACFIALRKYKDNFTLPQQ